MSEEMNETIQILKILTEEGRFMATGSISFLRYLYGAAYSTKANWPGQRYLAEFMKDATKNSWNMVPIGVPTDEDPKKIARYKAALRKAYVSFAELPDDIQGDGITPFIIRSEQYGVAQAMAERLFGKSLVKEFSESPESYWKNGVDENKNEERCTDAAELKTKELGETAVPSEAEKEAVAKAFRSEEQEKLFEKTRKDPDWFYIGVDKATLGFDEYKDPEDGKDKVRFKMPGPEDDRLEIDRNYIVKEDDKRAFFAISKNSLQRVFAGNKSKVQIIDGPAIAAAFDEVSKDGSFTFFKGKSHAVPSASKAPMPHRKTPQKPPKAR